MTKVSQLSIEYIDEMERSGTAMTFTDYRDHLESYGVPIDETARARRWLIDGHYLASIDGDRFSLSGKGHELMQQYREATTEAAFEKFVGRTQRSIDAA